MIELGKVTDAPDIASLEQQIFDNPYPITTIRQDIKNNKVIVVKLDNEVAGYITISHVLDEAEIERIAVSKKYLRQGIASALMEYALNQMKQAGATKIYLEVREDNVPAINLYRKFGFVITGKRKAYYRDGTDALTMAKL